MLSRLWPETDLIQRLVRRQMLLVFCNPVEEYDHAAMDEGHCGLPAEELVPLAEKLPEVPQELVRAAIDLELREGNADRVTVAKSPMLS